jgi:hypothetical protein
MGSIARRRGVYGGEYAPTGIRLFARWNKNRKKRLQKPGSGSAQIRSPRLQRCSPTYLALGARSRRPAAASDHIVVLMRCRIDQRIDAASPGGGAAWPPPAHLENGTRPSRGHEC